MLHTFEPSDGPWGQAIRARLRDPARKPDPEAELALFQEDRAWHVKKRVIPALRKGKWVIQERSYYSTLAYQGELGMDTRAIQAESEDLVPPPDLVLLIDLRPELALARIRQNRPEGEDAYENLAFQEGVRTRFLAMTGMLRLNGELPADELLEAAWAKITPMLDSRRPREAPRA